MRASIRRDLERDAWTHHPAFAHDLSTRRRARRDRRPLRWQDRTLLILAIALLAALLLRVETARGDSGEEWGLQMLADDGAYTSLALDTLVHVEVNGLLARVHVVQTFRNAGDQWAEGVYRFPLPDGAAVDRMYIEVGERVLEGEIQERGEAARTYQRARDNGHTASLVVQERANQFSTRLANIGPREDIRVMIGFLINVGFDSGAFSFRLPTTFNRRFGGEAQPGLDGEAARPMLVAAGDRPGPDHRLELQVDILTDIALAGIESRYHDVNIQAMNDGYRVQLVAGLSRTDRDFELVWYPDLAAVPQSSLTTWNSGEAVYAQLMLVPPGEAALGGLPREVVFIIDTSGSMQGASLVQAQAALLRGLDELGADDRFNLIQFNSATEMLFGASVPADQDHLERAREYIRSLRANGGTVMAPALNAALLARPVPGLMRQVIFVTDGSVGNERELLAAIAEELGDTRLFTVSIGSAPNSWFMRKAAEIGRGSHTHIGQMNEVEERMAVLWGRIRLPAIQDICVEWGVEAEYYPEVIPDLYAGQPLWVVARMPEAPSEVTLCGELEGLPWSHNARPFPDAGTETLATLWARRKIEALEDSVMFGTDPGAMRAQITRLALDHRLLTQFTSLVAVDRTPARLPGEALASAEVPSLLPAGSTTRTAGFPPTATGWKAQLLLSALVLLIAGLMFFHPTLRLPVVFSRPAPADR